MQYLILFVCLWLWRYTRTIVNAVSAWTYKPIRPRFPPSFTAKDVSVIIPTLGDNTEFRRCILSVAACDPTTIIVVTPKKNVNRLQELCKSLNLLDVKVLGAPRANKRLQMIQGTEAVQTPITVFADDDVFWPTTFLTYMLAPFEDPGTGAVGGYTCLERPAHPNFWDFLSMAYLERWNFEISATAHIDGGISCLSGRTSAVRTSIVKDPTFTEHFSDEKWLGTISLIAADDDNCITRWLVNHNWKIKIQCAPEAQLTTTLESNSKYLEQCVRWYRTTWRSNFTSLFLDRVIWTAQPWSTYALHLSSFNPPALIMDGTLAYLLMKTLETTQEHKYKPTNFNAFGLFAIWLLMAKTVKLWPHFYRCPSDLKFLPAQILFSYFHGAIKIYTLLTLHMTSWGGGHRSFVDMVNSSTESSMLQGSGYEALERTGAMQYIKAATDFKSDLKKRLLVQGSTD